jgi:hypothetical protein
LFYDLHLLAYRREQQGKPVFVPSAKKTLNSGENGKV